MDPLTAHRLFLLSLFPTPHQVVFLACSGRRGSTCEQEIEARGVRGGLCHGWPGSLCLVEGRRGAHSLLSLYFYSLKLECEKLATEKTEIQRHYVMVSEFHLKGARPLGGFSSEPSKDAQHRDASAPPRIWAVGPGPVPCFLLPKHRLWPPNKPWCLSCSSLGRGRRKPPPCGSPGEPGSAGAIGLSSCTSVGEDLPSPSPLTLPSLLAVLRDVLRPEHRDAQTGRLGARETSSARCLRVPGCPQGLRSALRGEGWEPRVPSLRPLAASPPLAEPCSGPPAAPGLRGRRLLLIYF